MTVGVSGSGGGFQRFCAGEIDISDASRPIKESEIEECAANGIGFIEVPVAFDGLTVVVNPENDWSDHLTVAELHHIFRPDDYAETWADVRAGFPDEEIVIFSPGVDSGTFDYFTETINDESGVQRQDNTTFSEDDNVLVIGVANEFGAIGYFGFSYYINNQGNLQAVPIDGGAGPVFPTTATVNDGSYAPLSRPLFIYVKTSSLDRPEVAAFVDYYLSDGRPIIDSPEVGYVQLPDNFYAAIRSRVTNRVTGLRLPRRSRGCHPRKPLRRAVERSAAYPAGIFPRPGGGTPPAQPPAPSRSTAPGLRRSSHERANLAASRLSESLTNDGDGARRPAS